MLSRAQNTFHHNPRLRGPVSSTNKLTQLASSFSALHRTLNIYQIQGLNTKITFIKGTRTDTVASYLLLLWYR